MQKKDSLRGSITLETAISLPIFIFLFLFIFGIFSIVRAENKMSHVLVQSSKSLAMDAYYLETIGTTQVGKLEVLSGLQDIIKWIIVFTADPYFASDTKWYEGDSLDTSVIKQRFVGFLTNGDKAEAESLLKDMGVVNGLQGVSFTAEADGKDVTIKMKYKLKYWMDAFDSGEIPIEKSVTVQLWKSE